MLRMHKFCFVLFFFWGGGCLLPLAADGGGGGGGSKFFFLRMLWEVQKCIKNFLGNFHLPPSRGISRFDALRMEVARNQCYYNSKSTISDVLKNKQLRSIGQKFLKLVIRATDALNIGCVWHPGILVLLVYQTLVQNPRQCMRLPLPCSEKCDV